MSSLTFSTTIEIYNGNPFVMINPRRAKQLKEDWKRPMPVIVQVNGQPKPAWHINMMPLGDGSFYLYLHGDVRKASNTKVGDTVRVEVAFDDAYVRGPQHPMPSWFLEALNQNLVAKAHWEALIPSRKKEILRYFSWLKSEQAIERNLAKAIHVLSGGSGRFMARSWKDGE